MVEVLLSKQNEKYFDRFWDDFFALFGKKVETSHFSSQPLRARAVRGVSSKDEGLGYPEGSLGRREGQNNRGGKPRVNFLSREGIKFMKLH